MYNWIMNMPWWFQLILEMAGLVIFLTLVVLAFAWHYHGHTPWHPKAAFNWARDKDNWERLRGHIFIEGILLFVIVFLAHVWVELFIHMADWWLRFLFSAPIGATAFFLFKGTKKKKEEAPAPGAAAPGGHP